MMDVIKVFGEKTKERKRLEAAAALINAEFDEKNATARVDETYWDYGGGIKWTTIIIGDNQVLSPLQMAKVVSGDLRDFTEVVEELVRKHWEHVQLIEALRNPRKAVREGEAQAFE